MTFHLYRTETTHYALSRDDVERLLTYETGEADSKSDRELAIELQEEINGDHGFEIVGELQFIDPDAEAQAQDDQTRVELT